MNDHNISFPEPATEGTSLEKLLHLRRSVRKYGDRPLTLAELGQLAFAGQGQMEDDQGRLRRTSPSAADTYPVEMLVVTRQVEGIQAGIHRYLPDVHGLRLLTTGDFSVELVGACLCQPWVARAQALFVLTGVWERIRPRYGDRSPRYIYMEAGAIAQNMQLQAASCGLGTVLIGGFTEEKVHATLRLDPAWEQVTCILAVGALP